MISRTSREQIGILACRYFETLLGDFRSIFLLLAQAPLIGWFCTLVWGSIERDDPKLHFILCLSAVWFGCINSCREIVKERAILERERFFGLSLFAYVSSKVWVLSGIGLAQVILLQMAVEWELNLKGPMFLQLAALFAVTLCGIGLGLLVSALAGTQERAVFAVPLLIIPQILFSEFAIPKKYFGDVVTVVEKFMPVRWGFQVFLEGAASEPRWHYAALDLLVLILYAVVLTLAATVALIPRREV